MSSWISPFKAVDILQTLVEFGIACKLLTDHQYRIELVKKFNDIGKVDLCLANTSNVSYLHINDMTTLLQEGQNLVVLCNIENSPVAIELLRIEYASLLKLVEAHRIEAQETAQKDGFGDMQTYSSQIILKGLPLGVSYTLSDNAYYRCTFSRNESTDFRIADIQDSIDIPHVRQQLDRLVTQLVDVPPMHPKMIHAHDIDNQLLTLLPPTSTTSPNVEKAKHDKRGQKRLYNPPSSSYSSDLSSASSSRAEYEDSEEDNVPSSDHRTSGDLEKRPHKRPRIDSTED